MKYLPRICPYKIDAVTFLICLVICSVIGTLLVNDQLDNVTDNSRRPIAKHSSNDSMQKDPQNKQGRHIIHEQHEAGKPMKKSQFYNKIAQGHGSTHQENKKELGNLAETKGTKRADENVILLWNELFGGPFDSIGKDGNEYICPKLQCTFTHDKTLLPKADAVVFHMWPADPWSFPKTRTPNQHYVFLLNESPARREYHLEWYDHFFNLTMTYRLDSDIPFLYGNKYPLKSPVPPLAPWWISEMTAMKRKKKTVAWMSSHCRTDSKREEYVGELKRYIPVDIYGRCGNLQCLPTRSKKCYDLIRDNYRFVLAFENSICKDYITEKVYESMTSGVVPVVYGGADYQKMLPPHSYINAADFRSPWHLAEYLQHLMNDDVEYLKYFQWKRSFVLTTGNHEWPRSFCRLCEILQNPSNRRKSYSVDELRDHWGPWNCDSNYLKAMQDNW